jgi:HAD superfamily hydrolase (TIGR01509 family)
MSAPAAVIFDNDGVLLDTESVWTRAEEQLYARHGHEFTLEHKQELVGTSAQIAGGIFERRLGQPGRGAEIVEELNGLVMAELANGVEAMAGARELLAELQRRETPVALVSNSPRAFIELALSIGGLEGQFPVTVSGHEVAAPKPAPDAYLEASRRLRVEPGPDVVVLEDSPTGVTAALAAGLTVVGIPSLPGIELPEAHLQAETLEDPRVLEVLGLGRDGGSRG